MRVIAPTAITLHFTPNYYVYTLAFQNRQFEYSAAIAFSLAIVTAILSSFVLFLTFRREQTS
jgi:multiple sugar transport system permease protein